MDIGITLPNNNAEMDGSLITAWARDAEAAGFSTLGVSDRVAYPSYDLLLTLAAAAAVTERIHLLTNILLGPTRNPVLLAKETATLDNLSKGRFILGIAVGGREDDFLASGQPFRNRGKRWDAELELMHQAWKGEPVAGSPKGVAHKPFSGEGVPIVLGGRIEPAMKRMAKWGIGMTMGLAGPEQVKLLIPQLEAAWREAGRPGKPRVIAHCQFAIGEEAEAGTVRYIMDYYGSQFRDRAHDMVNAMPRDKQSLMDVARQFEDAGADETMFSPGHAGLDQVERLADAVLR